MKKEKDRNLNPPRWAERLLLWFCSPHLRDEIAGDMREEFYYNVNHDGLRNARWKYILNVVGFLKPFATRRLVNRNVRDEAGTGLSLHYIKITLRSLRRQKILSGINILGLSLGLACCMLIALYTKDELSYDRFHHNVDQIFQLTCTRIEKGKKDERFAKAAMIQGPAFAKEIPEIESFVRTKPELLLLQEHGALFRENVLWVDSSFFSVFSFRLSTGNPSYVLGDLHSVVLSVKAAEKYFPGAEPIGKTLTIQVEGQFEQFTVTGVVQNPPANSSIKFDLLLPFGYRDEFYPDDGWHWVSFPTYFKIRKDASLSNVLEKMEAVYQTQGKTEIDEMKMMGYDNRTQWGLQSFAAMHLNTAFDGVPDSSDPIYSYALTGIAVFILVIACFNFVNLSIAQSLKRSKEIGIRKVIGSQRSQLARQFLGESFTICFAAFVFALIIAQVTLPMFNQISGKQLSLGYLMDFNLAIGAVALFVGIAFATGFYPALVLSSFSPSAALNGTLRYSGNSRLSQVLVVVQFSVTSFLIIAMIFMYTQFQFLTSKDLGYDDNNLLELTVNAAIMNRPLSAQLKAEFTTLSGIDNVAVRNVGRFGGPTKTEGRDIDAVYIHADEDMVPVLRLSVVQGRNFSKDFPADSLSSVLVNETFAKAAGWSDPIGRTIDHLSIPGWGDRKLTVVGVVRDFHSESLREKIVPVLFTYEAKLPLGRFLLRIDPEHSMQTVRAIEKVFLKHFPNDYFNWSFKDELNRNNYQAESRWKLIVAIAACITIIISCTGLFGLTALNTERRTREIGVRKVLGASAVGIVFLLFGKVIRLLLVALLIATPLVVYAVESWLRTFAYRISITADVFIISGLLITGLALITVTGVAFQAALANPVQSLRKD